MVKALKEQGVTVKIVSNTPGKIVINQLEKAGFLNYISRDDIFYNDQPASKYFHRAKIIQNIITQNPGFNIVYFDDSFREISEISKQFGKRMTIFGVPDGKGIESENNRVELIKSGAHYIVLRKQGFPVEDILRWLDKAPKTISPADNNIIESQPGQEIEQHTTATQILTQKQSILSSTGQALKAIAREVCALVRKILSVVYAETVPGLAAQAL